MNEHLRQSLTELLGPEQVVTDPVELITYERDAGPDRGRPDAVVFPRSTAEVQRVVRWAAEHGVPLVARGAGTGLSGGAVAERGGIVLEFARMDRILEIDPPGRSAVAEPGVVNLTLDAQAKARGLYYPPDPASGRSSTLGGNVAENAGGPHCFKYGVTTNYVMGLEVVLADGQVVHLGGRAFDYPEYDFCGLLTGSEGTLGVITQVSVRLLRHPPGVKTLMAAFESVERAGEAVSAVIAAGLVPATMEMMDQKIMRIIEDYVHVGLPVEAGASLIVEVDGYPAGLDAQVEEVADILRRHGAQELRIARTAEERNRIWYGRKSAAGALTRLAPAYYLVDITVPRSRLAETLAAVNEICERYGLRAGHVFHAGDGNLHPAILMNPRDEELVQRVLQAAGEMVELCIAQDGSITGEHGVGIEKRAYMARMYGSAELTAMWDVKQVFDPQGLLNPGKIFPSQMPVRDVGARHSRAQAMQPTPSSEEKSADTESVKGMPRPYEVFIPTSAEEAAQMLAALSAAGRPVRIGQPSSHPATEPSTAWLSTAALRGIKAYAPEDLYVTVGAGTPLAEVQEFLARDGMQVPLASPWSEATVGGLVAANVNGPLRVRYGSVRDLVLCATVALADGRVIRAGRPVVKNVAGYDLVKLFIGSHGTLGLITDVTLRLTPLPRARRTLLVPAEDLRRGLAWAREVLPLALVASAVVLVDGRGEAFPKSSSATETSAQPELSMQADVLGNASPLLAYTAEGMPEDVDAELAEVRAALERVGAPSPVEVEAPTGTDLWAAFLGREPSVGARYSQNREREPRSSPVGRRTQVEAAERMPHPYLQVRVGVPPKDLAAYVEAQAAILQRGPVLVDVAAGFVYATAALATAEEARVWLEALRRPALAMGGYAVVLDMPAALEEVLDRWGYQPEALDRMQALKARWDPAGILNAKVFVV